VLQGPRRSSIFRTSESVGAGGARVAVAVLPLLSCALPRGIIWALEEASGVAAALVAAGCFKDEDGEAEGMETGTAFLELELLRRLSRDLLRVLLMSLISLMEDFFARLWMLPVASI